MIVTRTPLRISLVGGGTDMPAFFEKQSGAVVSFAIDKYMYVSVNPKFDGRTRLSYSQVEEVDDPADLSHDIARETLLYRAKKGLEIASISDIPDGGSGLGSSSSYAVGLNLALTADFRSGWDKSELVEEAYYIERKLCGHPVGKQDHYAAGYGGLNFLQFLPDGIVTVERLPLMCDLDLESSLILFYTGSSRLAGKILHEQEKNLKERAASFLAGVKLKGLAFQLMKELKAGNIDTLGEILDSGWQYKKQLAKDITAPWIDELYEKARRAGATGGKLLGAGGGGFFLFAVFPERREYLAKELGLREVPFRIDQEGSKVIYEDHAFRGRPDKEDPQRAGAILKRV